VDQVFSVPRQWTDVVAPDAEVVIGEGRSLLRVADLLELADLVSRLVGQGRQTGVRKDIDAAAVKEPVPPISERVRRRSTASARLPATSHRVRKLDRDLKSGVVIITTEEAKCHDGKTAPTRRPQPFSRTAR
jgi:hypothetical protein